MPFNAKETASRTQVEILKFPGPGNLKKSIVLNANAFVVPTTGARYEVPAGTILTRVGDQHEKFAGSGKVAGILAHNVDLLAQTTESDEPAAMWFMGVVFATQSIPEFSAYVTNLLADLNLCKFE